MVNLTRTVRGRILLLVAALALWASTSSPALAAGGTTPFQASFAERTTFVSCPSGTPAGATCFRGEGNGTATPPGGPARHVFAGFVVSRPTAACPTSLKSSSLAAVFTSRGNLYLAAEGTQCPPTPGETGSWRAVGGTGVFAGASGGGSYATADVVFNPDGTVSSTTSYTGTLRLRGR
jgi:hypothetical protein